MLPFQIELNRSAHPLATDVAKYSSEYELRAISAEDIPDVATLRRWALHPDQNVCVALLERLAMFNESRRGQPIVMNMNVGFDAAGNLIVATDETCEESLLERFGDYVSYLIYCRAMHEAEMAGHAWTGLLDKLAVHCWPDTYVALGSDAALERGDPIWCGDVVKQLIPWIRSQKRPDAHAKILQFEYREVVNAVANNAPVLDQILITNLIARGCYPTSNSALEDTHWPLLASWAVHVLQSTEDGHALWSPFVPSHLQPPNDPDAARHILRDAIRSHGVALSSQDIAGLVQRVESLQGNQAEFHALLRSWILVALLEIKTLSPAYLHRLYKAAEGDLDLQRRVARHKNSPESIRQGYAASAAKAESDRYNAREVDRDISRSSAEAAPNKVTRPLAHLLDDPAASARELVIAAIAELSRMQPGKYQTQSLADRVFEDPRLATPEFLRQMWPVAVKIYRKGITYSSEAYFRAACAVVPVNWLQQAEEPFTNTSYLRSLIVSNVARRAAALYLTHGDKGLNVTKDMVGLVERLTAAGVAELKPGAAADYIFGVLDDLTPLHSEALLADVESWLVRDIKVEQDDAYPDVGTVLGFVSSNPSLPHGLLEQIIARDAFKLDEALSYNPALPDDLSHILETRYLAKRDAQQALAYTACVVPTKRTTARVIKEKDLEGARGLARKLHRIAEPEQSKIARMALRAIASSPRDSDAGAAGRIYKLLGDAAGVELINTSNDEIARAVARRWRWTQDNVFEALASYPRARVRRKMVPSGPDWGEPYDFSGEEEIRVRSFVVPRMLADRAKDVRERAQQLLDHWNGLEPNVTFGDVLSKQRPFDRIRFDLHINTEPLPGLPDAPRAPSVPKVRLPVGHEIAATLPAPPRQSDQSRPAEGILSHLGHNIQAGKCKECGCSETNILRNNWTCDLQTKNARPHRKPANVASAKGSAELTADAYASSLGHIMLSGKCRHCGCSAMSIGAHGWTCDANAPEVHNIRSGHNAPR